MNKPAITLSGAPRRVLDNDLLRVFATVVDHGGFTAAAAVLHRSQAAISLQIKRLEESTRAVLLHQPRQPLRLTDDGKILLDYARRMIALNDEAFSSLSSSRVTGKIRIGSINDYSVNVLPELLAEFCGLYPEAQIELQTGMVSEMERKLGSSFDLVIGIQRAGGHHADVLSREKVLWVTSAKRTPHLQQPLPLALLPVGTLFRDWAIQALSALGRDFRVAHESANAAAIEAAVVAGLAVSLFKEGTAISPGLRVLEVAEGFPTLPMVDVVLMSAPEPLSRAASRLREFLLTRLKIC
jgi:DNA-binding transcriptional LysR family regulator